MATIGERLALNEVVALRRKRHALPVKRGLVGFGVAGSLALGNSQVLDTLEFASPALPFPAQEAVQYAREAIEREDLADA
jgi:hypothetical protein